MKPGSSGRPFQKGQLGNPARKPKGVRNRATLAAEALLEGEAEALTRKAIKLGLAGDTTALRMCLEPLGLASQEPADIVWPTAHRERRGRSNGSSEVLAAVVDGRIMLDEAGEVMGLIESCR